MNDTGEKRKSERLFCLDLLRGLDIFFLTVCLPFFGWTLGAKYLPRGVADQLSHLLTSFTDGGAGAPTGITLTDFAQPVFIFITGVAAVFAVPRRLDAAGRPTRAFGLHLLGRLALLWSLGCVIRGALTLDLAKFTPYADTLQTIAVAYCGAALSLLIPSKRLRLAVPLVLLAAYGVVQATCGDYTRLGNVSRIVDECVFGAIGCKAKDFCYVLTTVAWASMGMLAALIGGIVKDAAVAPWTRVRTLAGWGLASTALGWFLAIWIPQNRYIYTVSFVFTTFGYATLLLDVLFVVTDIWRFRRGMWLFLAFGQCSLIAWMLHTHPLGSGLMAVAQHCVEGLPRFGVSSEMTHICAKAVMCVFIVLIVAAWTRRKGARPLALLLVCGFLATDLQAVPTAEAPTTDAAPLVGRGAVAESPAAALQRYVDRGEIAGAVSMVAVSGRVETASVGLADPTTGRPFDEKSLFWIASMSKGFCGAAVMSCVDRGLLSLDDPVEKYIPAIANVKVAEEGADGKTTLRPPKVKMTLRMCLSHVAGYPFWTPEVTRRGVSSLTLEEQAEFAARCPLLRDPLVRHQYSNVDINLAGRVVEIVTGQAFEDYLQQTFFDPLGMKDITFFPSAGQLSNRVFVARIANGKRYEDGRGDPWAKKPMSVRELRRGSAHASPASGLYSTASDVMKFYLMLANDGKAPDGRRILSHDAIVELSRAQYPELDRYTLGLRQFGDWFGHDGALQTEAYANWRENRAALLFVQVTGPWDHQFKLDWRATALSDFRKERTDQ